ncbi:MAG TPA: hypothetical protein VEA69_12255 [Tepidisphaeraceae bacterium]|nr:hypothetical protein [Tepidisphaeraceae bacterium]
MPDTSRVQLFFIGVQDFMRLIGGWGASGKFLRPACKTLPADAKIEAVTYDFERHAFVMRVSHPSFPPVECGAPIPWGGRVEVEVQGTTEADVSEAIQSWSMGKWKKALDEIAREKGVSVRDMLKNGPGAREATCKAQPAEYAGTNGIGKWAEKDGFYCSPVPIGDLPPKMAYTSVVVNPERGEQVGEVGRAQAADARFAAGRAPSEHWVDGTPVTIVGRGNAYDELKELGKLHDAIKPGSITFSGERVPPVVSWEDGEAPTPIDAPLWDNAPGGLVEASEVEAAQRMAEELAEGDVKGAAEGGTQSPGNPFYRNEREW